MDTPMRRRQRARFAISLLVPLACSGCEMLGAIFYTPGLRLIVLIVVAIAVAGALVSRSKRP
ncbi:hypothetical protein [Cognatilysobacter lacus]|uniref:Uncharacterized protein n=1 Tax=Cognatilysobacter lacus TaxID=1643323 RepID=A0A5D8Z9U6_9GAMM|nr:hypothetical protein [Lysobacter lacus]TZF91336.1 hypothetical protein FW784_02080 [Lysobacter lacus]